MQERRSCDTVGAPSRLKASGIHGPPVATDNVVSAAARIVGIVDSELGVIEDVKKLRAKLKLARFSDLKTFQQRHIEIEAAGIIQEVTAGIAKR